MGINGASWSSSQRSSSQRSSVANTPRYGFCEFQTEEDADCAVKIMNQIKIFGRPIRVNKASADKRTVINVGADIHVSGLDPSIDERTLLDTFSVFGPLMAPPRVCCLIENETFTIACS